MTTQEKTHTLELSEKELAAILFLSNRAIGGSTHQVWSRCKDILLEFIDRGDFEDKYETLSEECGYYGCFDYNLIEKEWEDFLGVSGVNREIKEKLQENEVLKKQIEQLEGK